jgi:hypothetical protein
VRHWLQPPEQKLKKEKSRLWLTPVIPTTQEAEMRRIAAGSQPRQKVHETLSEKSQSGSSGRAPQHCQNKTKQNKTKNPSIART